MITILFFILVIAGVTVYISFQNRFKKIVEYLDLLKAAITDKKPSSYKAEVTIFPNWVEIIKWYFPKLKTDTEAWEFIDKLFENQKIKIDERQSLYGKQFSFVEFYDGISGLNPIWSNHYEKFISDQMVLGWILEEEEGLGGILGEKFDIKNNDGERKSDLIEISPNHVATNQEYGGETISKIPYHDIVSFFVKIYQETGSAQWQVKKFPKEMQKYFDKTKITYEPRLDTHGGDLEPKTDLLESKSKWIRESGIELYRQNVEYHSFKTSYFEVSFKLEFFSPEDIGELNEAIALIRELGVDYKEKEKHHAKPEDIARKQVVIQLEDTVGEDAARILTKIAFNYFAKCAIDSGHRDLLSHPNFQQIKDYILGKLTLPTKKVIVDVAQETDIYDEVVADGRIPGHRVSFVEQDGILVSRISLIGKRTYVIHLGELPEKYRRENFGSAHVFDPIGHRVLGMTQNPSKWKSGIVIGFGLFNRI